MAPAALPAAFFVCGLLLASRLLPLALGLPAVGVALGLALPRRWALSFSAVCLGLVAGLLAPPRNLDGLDRSRTAEVTGEISGFWIEGPEGARATIHPQVVRQGARLWLRAPPIAVQLGAGIPPPPPGSRVRLRGELRRAAGYANERPAEPGRWRLRVKSAAFLALEAGPGWLDRAASFLRAAIEAPFRRHAGNHPGVAYAASILFGDLDQIPEREQRAFRRSGLAHLLAVSGMNVALAVAFLALPGAWLERRYRLALFAVAVAAHLLVVGAAPSLARASAMAAVAASALALARAPHPLQALALAAGALLLTEPALVDDIGFQLSCAATCGIVALAPRLFERRAGGSPRWRFVRLALATSLAAQIATLPLSVANFSNLSPASLILNLVYVPLASLLLISAFAWSAAALALPPAAGALALALDFFAAPFALLAVLPSGPWLTLPSAGTLAAGVLASALLAGLAFGSSRGRVTAVCAAAIFVAGARRPPDRDFELVVADVGQGDGILFRDGNRALLIDGGGVRGRDLAAQVWLPIFARRGIGSLAAMVVSHADSDHCGGLVDVAVHLPVAEVWGPPQLATSACVRELRFWSGARFRDLAAGDRLELGATRFEVLAPDRRDPPSPGNAVSLALVLEAGNVRSLFTGDLDGEAERRLAARAGAALRCHLLKVGHHGSAKSTGRALLEAARPRLALISAGPDNRFGHPAPELLERLSRARIGVLRTDLAGEIALSWRRGGPVSIALPGSPRAPR